MNFEKFNISKELQAVLKEKGFNKPTDIQTHVIPAVLEGKDVLAIAHTGTGKTGAFLIPLIERLSVHISNNLPNALILVPTRELAQQIGSVLNELNSESNITYSIIYGGVDIEEQIEDIRNGVKLVIATPGRLVDLIRRDEINLFSINMFVLDEADRMLDMGFTEDIEFIIGNLSKDVNTMLFSATMPSEVKTLSERILKDPFLKEVAATSVITDLIEQKVYYVEKINKNNLLKEFLRKKEVTSAIIFTKTRKSADSLNEYLQSMGFVCDRIHSDRSQHARDTVLESFRNGELPILIATDIAARGIDVSHLTHVFNFELPQAAETYIHRVGRTGRSGKSGIAITLCAPEEKAMLIDIQRLMKKCIPVVTTHTYANIALTKALQAADDKIAGKKEKNSYKGSKANGDFFRRQKLAQKKK